jgi:predicted nucleic acid-binding protein
LSNIIIADSSPLIAFGSINQLSILFQVFGHVIIPSVVAEECLLEMARPGALAISGGIDDGLIIIDREQTYLESKELLEILDPGEVAAISLANSFHAPLLIDEKLGRQVATRLGLKIVGTIGVLLLAKQKNIVSEVKPILMSLRNGHYFLSDQLVEEALIRAGEQIKTAPRKEERDS